MLHFSKLDKETNISILGEHVPIKCTVFCIFCLPVCCWKGSVLLEAKDLIWIPDYLLKSSIPLVSFLESSAVDKGLEMGRVCGIPQCSGPRGLFQSTSRRTLRLPAGAAHACHLRPLAQVLPHDDLQQRARWTHTRNCFITRKHEIINLIFPVWG